MSDYKTTQANAEKPALATAENAAQTITSTSTSKPIATDKKSVPKSSNPWAIQLYPSGYKENRP
ncbi:MAG: hypothetical protein ACXWCY_04235 [Burkholderiales bacterium]